VKILPKLADGTKEFTSNQHSIVTHKPVDGHVFQCNFSFSIFTYFKFQLRFHHHSIAILIMKDWGKSTYDETAVFTFCLYISNIRITGHMY